jgi:hypothetical protein
MISCGGGNHSKVENAAQPYSHQRFSLMGSGVKNGEHYSVKTDTLLDSRLPKNRVQGVL